MEIGTIELLREGAGIAIPEISLSYRDDVPSTALMTDTAGVKRPSAITQLAPNKVQPKSNILRIFEFLIHWPRIGRRLTSSAVESIVSVNVSKSESPSGWREGVCLSSPSRRLKIIYNTKVPPSMRQRRVGSYPRPDHHRHARQAKST